MSRVSRTSLPFDRRFEDMHRERILLDSSGMPMQDTDGEPIWRPWTEAEIREIVTGTVVEALKPLRPKVRVARTEAYDGAPRLQITVILKRGDRPSPAKTVGITHRVQERLDDDRLGLPVLRVISADDAAKLGLAAA